MRNGRNSPGSGTRWLLRYPGQFGKDHPRGRSVHERDWASLPNLRVRRSLSVSLHIGRRSRHGRFRAGQLLRTGGAGIKNLVEGEESGPFCSPRLRYPLHGSEPARRQVRKQVGTPRTESGSGFVDSREKRGTRLVAASPPALRTDTLGRPGSFGQFANAPTFMSRTHAGRVAPKGRPRNGILRLQKGPDASPSTRFLMPAPPVLSG